MKNVKLKTLLELSFGLILIFVLMIGSMALFEVKNLWNYTDILYNHPFRVCNTTRDIKNDILSIESSMKNICLDKNLNAKELDNQVKAIDLYEKKAYESFDIVYSYYLGPKADIDSAYNDFKTWRLIRDDIIGFKRSGSSDLPYEQFKINAAYRQELFKHIDVMIQFSTDKGNEQYISSRIGMKSIQLHLAMTLFILFLSTIIIVYYLIKRIIYPLKELTQATNQYSQGNYSIRSNINSNNEIGMLASSFNNLASTVEEELTIKSVIGKIAALLLVENDIKPFCSRMLNAMMTETGSASGAIYFLNKNRTKFSIYASGGKTADWTDFINFEETEGPDSKFLTEKNILHFTKIPGTKIFSDPENTSLKELICVPFLDVNEVVGALFLCSQSSYTSFSVKLVKECWFRLNANLNRVVSFKKMNEFSLKVKEQNHQLELQSKELIKKNSELEVSMERAEMSDRLKTIFLLNMSHELRTPLNSIIGFSGILLQQLPGPLNEEQMKQVKMVQASGCHLLSLINDILDISKIESGELIPNYEYFDVQDVIEDVIKMVWPFANGKHLPINFVKDPEFGEIKSDRKRVQQVILNIVNNAVKFTDKGFVGICCLREVGYIHIEISDTGIGIKKEDQNLLFNPFVQLENNMTRKFEGSGLGLSISKKLVQMLNGKITLKSEYGVGSCFVISLPLIK